MDLFKDSGTHEVVNKAASKRKFLHWAESQDLDMLNGYTAESFLEAHSNAVLTRNREQQNKMIEALRTFDHLHAEAYLLVLASQVCMWIGAAATHNLTPRLTPILRTHLSVPRQQARVSPNRQKFLWARSM